MSGRRRTGLMAFRRPAFPLESAAYLTGLAYLVTTMCYLVIRMSA